MIIAMESSVCINEEILFLDYISEYSYIHQRSLEVIGNSFDDSDINSFHSKAELDITPIDLTNYTTCILQIHYVNVVRNFVHLFYHPPKK